MKPSVMAIVARVCALFDVDSDTLLGNGRRRDFVLARHAAWWLCRKRLGLTYVALGDEFGVDHSSMIVACNKFEAKLADPDRYPWLIENVSILIEQLKVDAPMLVATPSGNPFWRRPPVPVTGDEAPLKLVRGGK
jgi:hypothetical protein